MHRTLRTLTLLVSVLALGACPDDAPLDEPEVESHGGRADRTVSTLMSVDEFAMSARFDAEGLHVTLPLTGDAGVDLDATATVYLTTLEGEELAEGSGAFRLTEGDMSVEVTLEGAEAPPSQGEQSAYLLRYDLSAGEASVSGTRSLYHTMGKLGLRVWAPTRVDAGTQTTLRFWVRDLLSGALLEGAEVRLGEESATTDMTGQVAMEVDVPEDATSLELEVVASHGDTEVSDTRTIQVVPAGAPKLMVSTDKPLYRPGQTIHIRAMALAAKDLEPVGSEPITLEVLDGKQNKIFKSEAETNAYGIASLTAPLAIQVNTGDYTIRAIMAEVSHEITVEVSEEKLPKFALTATFDSPYFAPGETISGVLSAQYFFGKSVVGADVTIEVPGQSIDRPSSFSGTTDAAGLMPFTLPGGAAAPGVTLVVTVVDTAGFSVMKTFEAKVASPQLYVQLQPESSMIPEGVAFRVFVQARDPLGRLVDADCMLGQSGGTPFSTDGGLALVETTAQNLYVSCETTAGVVGSASMWVSKSAEDVGLLMRSDKALYAPGDEMTLSIFGPKEEEVVYVDCIHRGRIVASHVVSLEDGVGEAVLSTGGGKSGTLHFTAYYVNAADQVVSTDRVAYLRQPGAQVSVSTDADSYLPGAESTLTFTLSDEEGAPQAGAIGVTIADEAVFALAGGSGAQDVRRFFQLSDAPEAVHPYAMATDPASLQLEAEAALAGVSMSHKPQLNGLDASALQAAVRGIVNEALYTMRNEISSDLQEAVNAKTLSADNAIEAVAALDLYDFWGKRVALEAELFEDSWSSYMRLRLHSYGPDELADTWDDWNSSISVWFPVDGDFGADEAAGAMPNAVADAGASYPSEDYGYSSDPEAGPEAAGSEAPKKRDDFPETLYVNPALIIDESGEASVTLPLADAITSWRVSMIANTANGLVGSGLGAITVFQEFFVDVDLPRKLTQNDRLSLPVGVFNFGDTDQSVVVSVTEAPWFALAGEAQQSIVVPAGASAAVPFEVTVLEAGYHELEVSAIADSGSGDQIGRTVQVIPDGQRIDVAQSGPLEGTLTESVTFPANRIDGGNGALLKVMGGSSAQVVDGVEALLRTPRGCFEPMMNSTWINALVLDYMGWTDAGSAELEANALANLDDGVQQSITFECTGGGFTWFGDPDPAHPILSAFALLMFEDIKVNKDVDEGLVNRAIAFLEGQQQPDGSWDTTQHTKNQVIEWDALRTTCIVANGLAANGTGDAGRLGSAVSFIDAEMNLDGADTYTLAMCANALLDAAPGEALTDATVAELMDRAQTDEQGLVYWDSDFPGVSNAGGEVILVETTALATQALFKMELPPELTGGALKFLASMKSADGNFRSTQGTIQAMRAFVAAAKFAAGETDAQVVVSAGDQVVFEMQIDSSNMEVVHLVSLAEYVDQDVDVTIEVSGEGKLYYALSSRHYVPWDPATRRVGPNMDVQVSYSLTELTTEQSTVAQISVVGTGDAVGPGDMPMVDVGLLPGFEPDFSELDHLVVADPNMARYEIKGDRVWIYLHELSPDKGFSANIPMSPRFAMEITTPPARAWEFFKPEAWSESVPVTISVTEAEGS